MAFNWMDLARDPKTGRWTKAPISLDRLSGANINWKEFDITQPFTFPLSSTCVATMAYNPFSNELFIEFTDGSEYEYSGVPQWVVLDLIQSSSAGRYFNYHIRDQYMYNLSGGNPIEGWLSGIDED